MALWGKKAKVSGCISIALQPDGIRAAAIHRNTGGMPVVDLCAFYSAEKTALAKSLLTLGKDLHANQFQCSNLLTSAEYQLLSVDAPNVPQPELKTAMRWRLKDMLDYHINDATIDVLAVPADSAAAGRANSMFAVAARNQLIQDRQALFADAKIPLTVIDIPEMAQRNIAALLEPPGRGLGLLSFDNLGGLLTVSFAGELYLSRRLDITLAQISNVEDAQRESLYERITLELQRTFDHFDRQYRNIALAKLMLFPLGEAGSALQAHLAANLYFPVDTFQLDSIIDLSKVPELRQLHVQQQFFLPVGAALRHEELAL